MRIRKGREFFNVTPDSALDIFRQCALTLDDAEIEVTSTRESKSMRENGMRQISQSSASASKISHNQSRHSYMSYCPKAAKLTFSMLGIQPGSELVFSEDPNVKTQIINSHNMIMLEDGTRATLSAAVAIVKRRLGTATQSEAYQGGNYWLYNGERLTTIRKRLEADFDMSASNTMSHC